MLLFLKVIEKVTLKFFKSDTESNIKKTFKCHTLTYISRIYKKSKIQEELNNHIKIYETK